MIDAMSLALKFIVIAFGFGGLIMAIIFSPVWFAKVLAYRNRRRDEVSAVAFGNGELA